ncbi:MAG: amino acid lyase [Brevundimonas sp.]|nr:MAG: amino acid lyase [Brevundimonas sp.]
MDRRAFLFAATTAAALPSAAFAQAYGQTAPAPVRPSYPPVDARSVWLVGDSAPPDPVGSTRKLLELVEATGEVRDSYLAEGAVKALETRFAALLGKEDCAFLPTGTLANQVALRVLCGDDQKAIVQHESHVYRDESDAAQILAGLNLTALAPGRTSPTLDEVIAAVDEAANGPYPVKTGAIALESPVRRTQGQMVPPALAAQITGYAREKGIRTHLDGARLLLAAPEFDTRAYAGLFDTVYVSLYKYLGAPFGAVLAGSREHIAEARALRHIYGGTIYQGWQAALLANAALETFPDRIAQSHRRARELFTALEAGGKIKLRPAPDASNIFEFEISDETAAAALERSRPAGVRIGMPRNGVAPFYVNETILRRPVEDYVRIFLG